MKDFLARVGTFFFLMGIGLFILFIASDASAPVIENGRTLYELLCGAVTLVAIGFLFRKTATPPQAADRFRTIRKIQERRAAAKKEKASPQQSKK
jgi:hypothetical protein